MEVKNKNEKQNYTDFEPRAEKQSTKYFIKKPFLKVVEN